MKEEAFDEYGISVPIERLGTTLLKLKDAGITCKRIEPLDFTDSNDEQWLFVLVPLSTDEDVQKLRSYLGLQPLVGGVSISDLYNSLKLLPKPELTITCDTDKNLVEVIVENHRNNRYQKFCKEVLFTPFEQEELKSEDNE